MKMKMYHYLIFGLLCISISQTFGVNISNLPPDSKPNKKQKLFDGKTFKGWEGDTLTWRIQDGMLVGGSLDTRVPHNNFLSTKKIYHNFYLKLKIKLTGTEGFVNSGIQFRSVKATNPAYEMIGYQADWGKDYWASLYDESRRNKTLMKPNEADVLSWIKQGDWNTYEVRAENERIRLYINGKQTVDYTEMDASIPQSGLIALQIHGGAKAIVAFKDIYLQELP
jgi:hypothetical protein